MEVRGTIPRLPSSILQDIARLQKELHRRAALDKDFSKFIYDRSRYPFRVLGFTNAAQSLDDTIEEWEQAKT